MWVGVVMVGGLKRTHSPSPIPIGTRTRTMAHLLVGLGRVFVVRTLDNGIDGARLLAESAVDALGHVDVVARRAARAIRAHLRLNRDGLRGAHRFAQLARDAALFAARIPTERVLSTEARRELPLLERIVDGDLDARSKQW